MYELLARELLLVKYIGGTKAGQELGITNPQQYATMVRRQAAEGQEAEGGGRGPSVTAYVWRAGRSCRGSGAERQAKCVCDLYAVNAHHCGQTATALLCCNDAGLSGLPAATQPTHSRGAVAAHTGVCAAAPCSAGRFTAMPHIPSSGLLFGTTVSCWYWPRRRCR